ncbi:kinase-like domain-containing protein [Mycena leptocephala]|nr:kinase-like domain-containing protein [Mycena leptocephala]
MDSFLPDVNGQIPKGRVVLDSHFPFAAGGDSNIYRGKFTTSDGREIRLDDAVKRLKREAEIWAQLKHKHVVPFIGVCDDVAPRPVLVSPLYKLGHAGSFLRNNPAANREDMVIGVASGLEYLHAKDIVHGDVKVSNVLVDKGGIPSICDFGISKILDRSGFTTSRVGTCPYMAPELFIVISSEGNPEMPSTTKSSDVYSFALLALEILSSEPLKARPTAWLITIQTFSELRPKRADYKVTDGVWSVLDQCWEFDPHSRPTISNVRQQLSSVFNGSAVDALDAGQLARPSFYSGIDYCVLFQPHPAQFLVQVERRD